MERTGLIKRAGVAIGNVRREGWVAVGAIRWTVTPTAAFT
jgi:hypothetical protein